MSAVRDPASRKERNGAGATMSVCAARLRPAAWTHGRRRAQARERSDGMPWTRWAEACPWIVRRAGAAIRACMATACMRSTDADGSDGMHRRRVHRRIPHASIGAIRDGGVHRRRQRDSRQRAPARPIQPAWGVRDQARLTTEACIGRRTALPQRDRRGQRRTRSDGRSPGWTGVLDKSAVLQPPRSLLTTALSSSRIDSVSGGEHAFHGQAGRMMILTRP